MAAGRDHVAAEPITKWPGRCRSQSCKCDADRWAAPWLRKRKDRRRVVVTHTDPGRGKVNARCSLDFVQLLGPVTDIVNGPIQTAA